MPWGRLALLPITADINCDLAPFWQVVAVTFFLNGEIINGIVGWRHTFRLVASETPRFNQPASLAPEK